MSIQLEPGLSPCQIPAYPLVGRCYDPLAAPVPEPDTEIAAMAECVRVLDGLDRHARERVLNYVCERYEKPI